VPDQYILEDGEIYFEFMDNNQRDFIYVDILGYNNIRRFYTVDAIKELKNYL